MLYMKKIILAFIFVCFGCVPVFADETLQSQAVRLVHLLDLHKGLTGDAAVAYRSKWETVLEVAIPRRPDIQILPFIYNAIGNQKQSTIDGRSYVKPELLKLVNEIRMDAWLSGLQYHTQLDILAQSYADDMQKNNYFSHVSKSGETLAQRIQSVDYPYTLIGENLAKGYMDAASVVTWWMDSPGHRANILELWFVHMWLGRNGEYRVQLFGKPE